MSPSLIDTEQWSSADTKCGASAARGLSILRQDNLSLCCRQKEVPLHQIRRKGPLLLPCSALYKNRYFFLPAPPGTKVLGACPGFAEPSPVRPLCNYSIIHTRFATTSTYTLYYNLLICFVPTAHYLTSTLLYTLHINPP